MWQDTVNIPVQKENAPDPLPPFDQFYKALDGHGTYPFVPRPNVTGEKVDAPRRALHLENEYLHCIVLPDAGGHLYSCRDKLSGAEVLFPNDDVAKLAPVDFATTTNEDGSATVFTGAVDRISGIRWRVAYTLRPGSAVLEQETSLYNPGSVRQSYQWWTSAAVRVPGGGLQFALPAQVTASYPPGVLESWPVDTKGVDRRRSVNYSEPLQVFAYASREPFFGTYNVESRTGLAHWADPREMPGKQIRVSGNKDRRDFVDIQAGVMPLPEMMEYLPPQESRSFSELWIPFRNTGGITRVTPDAVLFLQRTQTAGGTVKAVIDLNVTSVVSHAKLTVTKGGTTVLQQTTDLDPARTFHVETEPVEASGQFRIELRDESGRVLLAHLEDHYDAVAPGQVKIGAPIAPRQVQTALARGDEADRARMLDRAAEEYETALRESPKNRAAPKASGLFYVQLNQFEQAITFLEPLQHGNKSDAQIAYYLGIAKSELGDDAAARPLWDAYLTDARLGLASQYRLACSYARAGDQKTAARMLHAVAAVGPGRAAGLDVAIQRRMGQTAAAESALRKALAADPADSLLRVESVLLGHDDPTIWSHLAADPERVLDIADAYFDAGLFRDAITVLEHEYPAVSEPQMPGAVLPQNYPLIAYYRGYARSRIGESAAADFQKAAAQSTLYVYPYRASTYRVLRGAIEQNAGDATAHYLLGCLLFNDRATEQALAEWKLAKPASARIAAYDEIVSRAEAIAKKDAERAGRLARELEAARKAQQAARRAVVVNPTPIAPANNSPSPAPPSFSSPAEAADFALNMLADRRMGAAESVFQVKNFPEDKQSPEVRRVYAELQLQNLIRAAHPGNCDDVSVRIEDFTPERTNLPFTFHGFGDFAKQLRTQFYFGLAEWLCGDQKAAERRWRKIARSKKTETPADFAFPAVAAALIDPAGAKSVGEQALESLRAGAGPSEQGERLYAEGMLLRAAGRDSEAVARFKEGASDKSTYAHYLNASAQQDPPLPFGKTEQR